MNEYIKEIEQIAIKSTESQSDGYSQIMRICDAMREQMSKYICEKTKDEILEIIADEFDKVNRDYDDAMQNNNKKLKERSQGRYVAMFDLLHRLEIYEK